MTLIIKELVVRGIVTNEDSRLVESSIENEELMEYLDQLKKKIEIECTDKVLKKLDSKIIR